jgi:O-antigen/teichoic acid export membrane protein
MSFLSTLLALPQVRKAWNFGKLAGVFGSSQILVQALGFVSGILIVRWLPPEQYALYMLALTMLGTMSVLANGGISVGVMAEGGKVWQDRKKLGSILATGLYLRNKFAVWSVLICIPILIYLLHSHGASWLSIIGILCGIGLMFWTSLSGILLEIVPKLHQEVYFLSKISVIQAVGRAVLVLCFVWIIPCAAVALIAGGLPLLWTNFRLRHRSLALVDFTSENDQLIKYSILQIVKRVLPNDIYYCISSQLFIWLIGFIGSTTTIAEVSALGRISQVLLFVTILTSTLIVPRFAKLPHARSILRSWVVFTVLGVLAMAITIFGVVCNFPESVLTLLGNNYQNMSLELIISTATSVISILGGTIFCLCIARGWVLSPAISIPLTLLPQLMLIPYTNFSSTKSVLIFSMICACITTTIHFSHIVYRLNIISTNSSMR